MYRLILLEAARRALDDLPKHYRKLITDRIEALSNNPRPYGCKKLHGHTAYRVRQGPYRIIYEVDDSGLVVVISYIKPRREAYR